MSDLNTIMAAVQDAADTGNIIDARTAGWISQGWIAPSNPAITTFFCTHEITDGLAEEIHSEINYVTNNPHHFDNDTADPDLGTAEQNITMLRAWLAHAVFYGLEEE